MVQKRRNIKRNIQWILIIILIIIITPFINNSLHINEINACVDSKDNESDKLKIIHLSDIHIKDLEKTVNIEKLIKSINDLQGDIIVFTGDYGCLDEMKSGYEIFPRLKCKYKKYAVLGNHDYGVKEQARYNWKSEEEKKMKEGQLKALYNEWGIELLLNESDTFSYNNHLIAVIGLKVHDPHHGYFDSNLDTAIYNVIDLKNKILLIHNPDFWDEEAVGKYNIKLTLAGHTHGGQIGIGLGNFKISPAQLMFSKWRGLYKEDNELLIVNTGLGTYRIPFRYGMNPEIISISLSLL